MKRFINQMNVSITTNRFCNLHCTHCYIMPEAFKNKSKLSYENFMKIFKVIDKLNDIDTNLEEIEWETLGGETTMMPFEFWEKALPYSLKEIDKINKKNEKDGSMNFITNLIVKDNRYFDLFNKFGDQYNFSIYTSWEPDTERFGKNNEKLEMYYNNIEKINKVENKTLDIIFTKKIIELGPSYILKTFLPLGIRDFSFKMISPYGSGKDFFNKNMVDFKSMEKYLKKFDLLAGNAKGKEITFTPQEEIKSSVYKNESFQCNGNFYYDLSIEPEGIITFNASQTLTEAVVSYNKSLDINEDNVEYKIMFENIKEAYNKLELKYKECDDCKYLIYCNAGWYHYKINKDIVDDYSEDACPGLKDYWDFNLKNINLDFREPKLQNMSKKNIEESIKESVISKSYDEYFKEIKKINKNKTKIIINKEVIFGKTILERILFYDSLDIYVEIKEDIYNKLTKKDRKILIKNIVNYNYKIKVISSKLLMEELNEDEAFIKKLEFVLSFLSEEKELRENTKNNINYNLIEGYIFIFKNIDMLKKLQKINKNNKIFFTKYENTYFENVYDKFIEYKKVLKKIY